MLCNCAIDMGHGNCLIEKEGKQKIIIDITLIVLIQTPVLIELSNIFGFMARKLKLYCLFSYYMDL